MEKKKCLRCGYEWMPRIETKPKACPYCKNPKWDIPRKEKKDKK